MRIEFGVGLAHWPLIPFENDRIYLYPRLRLSFPFLRPLIFKKSSDIDDYLQHTSVGKKGYP